MLKPPFCTSHYYLHNCQSVIKQSDLCSADLIKSILKQFRVYFHKKREMEKGNLRKSETTAVNSDESCKMIVDELLMEIFDTIANKFYKLKSVELYYGVVKELLTEIIDVYDKPKPCSDHTHIIEAWKRDKPAQVAEPDILIKNCV